MNHPINNLSPLREGSSFHKATRVDGLYSAVKIFPFVFSSIQNENLEERAALVRLAIDEYRADIPRVLDWGQTGSSSSYIEFDWTVGQSLAEKFRFEKNSLMTIQEVITVAEQVSRTLTLCHKIGLQHGAVSLKEIIWDAARSRYVLTGFFSSIRDAGKDVTNHTKISLGNHTEDLQKKDIKDLGFVLIQLLTGNAMINKFDIIQLNLAREKAIPPQWSMEKFEEEKYIPVWLSQLIIDSISGSHFSHMGDFYFSVIRNNKQPTAEKKYRSKPYANAPVPAVKKLQHVSELKSVPAISNKKSAKRHFVFDGMMAGGLLIAALLFGFSMYSQKKQTGEQQVAGSSHTDAKPVTPLVRTLDQETLPTKTENPIIKKEKELPVVKAETAKAKPVFVDKEADSVFITESPQTNTIVEDKAVSEGLSFFMVKSKAYFHNEPDESTKRKAFIIHWNRAILVPIKEENDFVYVVFTNKEGQTSRGWLKKSDLMEVDEK